MAVTKGTALLVMDVQPSILERIEDSEDYLARVKEVVDVAHKHEVPVIYVVVGFRPGLPEISPNNQSFAAIKQNPSMKMTDPKPAIDPEPDDVVVTKRRVSAYTGSDLEVILRAQGIRHLVLCGIATSGVVLSTVREAADKDYQLTVISDLCADMDTEIHKVLIEKVFPRQASVIMAKDWLTSSN
jgi:nicotinamidase-related amidase